MGSRCGPRHATVLAVLPLLLAALAVGHVALRARRARTVNEAYRVEHRVGPDGIAHGAHGFRLEGRGTRALLLLHGSGDTPQSLRYLAQQLQAGGYTVSAPLLPGHGTSPADFAVTSADDYLEAARAALSALVAESPWVGLVGLSMGGALACQLATEAPGVRVVVLLAPYLTPPWLVRWTGRLGRAWGLGTAYLAGRGETSVHNPRAAAEGHAYGTFSPGALRALLRTADRGWAALGAVRQPMLVVNSEEDNRIPPALAREALAQIRAPLEEHWVRGCGHVITVDYCRDEVARLVRAFLERQPDNIAG